MIGGCSDFINENFDEIASRVDAIETQYYIESSTWMEDIENDSVELVVTSPPYPGIEMWDELGSWEEIMSTIYLVVSECQRVVVDGGIICINIGDAPRTTDDGFRVYPNHAWLMVFSDLIGLTPMTPIHWKKPTNKPNSFLGSGFEPPNAYVMLDIEHILVFRNGDKRKTDRLLRRASAYTKEERDTWFSQEWNIKGEKQDGRATFPPEIPYRLIRMFSLLGDTVLDPFSGTGTTLQIAQALGRDAIGYDNNPDREEDIVESISRDVDIDTVLSNLIRHEKRGLLGVDSFLSTSGSLINYGK